MRFHTVLQGRGPMGVMLRLLDPGMIRPTHAQELDRLGRYARARGFCPPRRLRDAPRHRRVTRRLRRVPAAI